MFCATLATREAEMEMGVGWADGDTLDDMDIGIAEVKDASRAPAKGRALLGEEIDDHMVNKKQECVWNRPE